MPDPLDTEAAIRDAWVQGDLHAATTLTLQAYGPEVLGFLVAQLRSTDAGREAFAMFAEDMWVGMPKFGWRCSMRGWSYVLARNAACRYARRPDRALKRNLSLSLQETVLQVQCSGRSATAPYQRTEVKERVRALRDQLTAEEQLLLSLHIDKGLPWRELAMVMHEGGESLDSEALDREAARMRKRFERVKARLRRLAAKEGLLSV